LIAAVERLPNTAFKSIWDEIRGQSILGEEGFIGRFINHISGYEEVKEILRSQRYLILI